MQIVSTSQAISGSEAIFSLAGAITAGATFIPYSLWPAYLTLVSTGGIAYAAAVEYVNVGASTSVYDGLIGGATALNSATMSGAYLADPQTSAAPMTILVAPYPIGLQANLRVHVFGASGTILIAAGK